jgi:hypothetical protein
MNHLWQAARLEVAEERWDRYLFATFDALETEGFTDEVWLDLENDEVSSFWCDMNEDDSPSPEPGPVDDAQVVNDTQGHGTQTIASN